MPVWFHLLHRGVKKLTRTVNLALAQGTPAEILADPGLRKVVDEECPSICYEDLLCLAENRIAEENDTLNEYRNINIDGASAGLP